MHIKRFFTSIGSILLVFFFSTQIAAASPLPDEGNLSGKVTDQETGQPISGATVSIPDLRIGVITDGSGSFFLTHIPNGTYLLQVQLVGYASYTAKVNFLLVKSLNIKLRISTIESGEVVVTGVSHATEVRRSPVPIVAVGKIYLDQRAASGNIIDEIANLPGINAVTTGPNVSKPFIHGLGYNRVVTLQDGIRQEGQQWGDEHGIEIDQNSIDRIEVIKGPASLTYGSDAIGGVVNLISPTPVAAGKIEGSVLGAYGTNQGLLNGSFRLYGNQNGFVWGTIVSAKEAKDYQNLHDGRVYNTGYKEKDARIMIGLNKGWGNTYLNASVFDDLQEIPNGSRDSITRKFTKQITEADTYRPIVSPVELNSYRISPLHQHVQLYRIYDNSNIILGNGNLLVNLGYQFSHRQEFTHPTQPSVAGLNLNLQTYTYDVKYNFDLGNDIETSAGINGMYQTNTLGQSTAFPIPAYHQFDIGPFFVLKKSFNKLDVSLGARYDSRSFNSQSAFIDTTNAAIGFPTLYTGSDPAGTPHVIPQFTGIHKNFSGLSGSFGATYNFNSSFLVKANIARGFRAPSIAEISANGPDPGSQIYHIGNANFKPEFGLQEDLGAFLALPSVSASVELFNNDISNYIFQEELLNKDGSPVITQGYTTFTYVQSKARISGGEISLDIHPRPWLHFENSISLTYGRNLGNGQAVPDSLKYLPFIPPLHTHSELRASLVKRLDNFTNLYVFLGLNHYNAQNRYFAAYGTETATGGYNLLSAGFGGNIVNKKGKTIVKVFVEGTNLTNVNYQSNMSRLKYFDNARIPAGVHPGIFNMGRNIDFKVAMPFDLITHSKTMGS